MRAEGRASVLRLRGRDADWGVRASLVERVVPREAWTGELPFDAAAWIGVEPAQREPVRVLVLPDTARTLEARGEIDVVEVDAIVPLPSLIRTETGPWRLSIVFAERVVFVLEPFVPSQGVAP